MPISHYERLRAYSTGQGLALSNPIRLEEIHLVHTASMQVLSRYPGVFLGTLKGFKAIIYVEHDTPPRFFPARSVPYAMRDKVDNELQCLQRDGIIEPVEIAEWAAPIVIVLKNDSGNVRVCGDFRITVNPVSKLDRYPIPKVEDLFARLSGGKHFSKLDLSHAYQQLPLDEDSVKYVVVNTHKEIALRDSFSPGNLPTCDREHSIYKALREL